MDVVRRYDVDGVHFDDYFYPYKELDSAGNDLEFPEGDQLLEAALPAARNIARLTQRAREAKVPVIYVNDNFGRWRSDFKKIVDRCLHDDVRGRPIVELLVPDENDYFVLKPKHSGFFSTTLDLLLRYLGVRTLVVAGFAGI